MTTTAIHLEGLVKSYGDLSVLRGVDFDVAPGSIFALLGSNGAGKTTVVRILATLLDADSGTASVNGFDVATQPAEVRESISLTGQFAAVDEILTGRENLVLVARLRHLMDSRGIADGLLERFALVEAADRRVSTYSGGMRRRLDIAMSLIGNPPVVFLDEPTTGLDPQARLDVWDDVRNLARQGTTVLLTTQYLDEADRLADTIVVIDRGLVVAEGTPEQLKASIGRPFIRVTLPEADAAALERVRRLLGAEAEVSGRSVSAPAPNGLTTLGEVVAQLGRLGAPVHEVGLEYPSLDEVFSLVTDHSGKPTGPDAAAEGVA